MSQKVGAADRGGVSVFPGSDYTASERAALLGWRFCRGDSLTASDVATLCECTVRQARRLLIAVCRVIPVYRDDDGTWKKCPDAR